MRALFVSITSALLMTSAIAQDARDNRPSSGASVAVGDAEAEPSALDLLFAELKREPSFERAEAIASRIQAEWLRSGSATVDLLLGWALQASSTGNHGAAFDLFDQALLLAPDHAETWNARATLHYQLDAYQRSIADIEETLRREPRHFGALVGLGAILEELGQDEAALRAQRRALELYPALRPAQEAAARISARLRGTNL